MKGARPGSVARRLLPPGAPGDALVGLARRARGEVGLLVFLGLLMMLATLIQPRFANPSNLRDILVQAAPLLMVTMGQAFVILVRGLDLSVASLMATVAVLATAFEAQSDVMIVPIFVAAIAFSALVGLVNGWLVAGRGVSPFLATLAMMILLQGLRFSYTQGAPAGNLPPGFRVIGAGDVLGVPINLLAALALAVLLGVILHRGVLGRRIFIVGGNLRAATLVGISADRVTVTCYVICSVMAGIGGLFLVGFVGTVDNWVGRGYELDSIVAAVMGGVALSGGRGSIAGALLGALILVMIFNVIVIMGLPVQAQFVVKGVVIIVAAAMYANWTVRKSL
ncbi:MAG: ABC transporter permease [Thiotrichales bacterium]|nr:ABC transporter permease [Thiotrichales bacterium]